MDKLALKNIDNSVNQDEIKNTGLNSARAAKNDEFYTQISDIEKELRHYTQHFKGKTVYCNCDDPRVSNFFHYFSYSFEHLDLKKLITTCYKSQSVDLFSTSDVEQAISLEYNGDKNGNKIPDLEEIGIKKLKGDGDFRSEESIELLKQADVVVTNPPFSLFREYVQQLVEYNKKFLIIGNLNAASYKEIFALIKTNKIWFGVNNGAKEYVVSEEFAKEFPSKICRADDEGKSYTKMGNTYWYTNLDIEKRHEELILYKTYSPEEYPTYDNYDAIEVSKTKDIPFDYNGAMGVPIAFLDKYNPEQFEILGITDRDNNSGLKIREYTANDTPDYGNLNRRGAIKVDGKYKSTYARLLIKRRK